MRGITLPASGEVSGSGSRQAFPVRGGGNDRAMIGRLLVRLGFRGWQLQGTSLANVVLCLGLWIRAKTVDQEERGNAERRAIFVGLWPVLFWLIGDSVEQASRTRSSRLPWR